MSRIVSQALIARSTQSTLLVNRTITSFKQRHTVAEGTLIEIDLETSTESGDSSSVRIVRIEDLMHTIIAQRSAPSWLPFIPGSSYWVPPKRSPKNIANSLNKLSFGPTLSAEEALSLTTIRGWPSSDHLFGGNKPSEVKPKDFKLADTEVQVKSVYSKTKCPDDEEESD